MIADQLVHDIYDEDILDPLIGDEKTDRSLQEMVMFIACREQAKMERGTVSCERNNTTAATVPTLPATPSGKPAR